jgi:hypothetical protein
VASPKKPTASGGNTDFEKLTAVTARCEGNTAFSFRLRRRAGGARHRVGLETSCLAG